MKLSSSPHCIDVYDLPPGLSGKVNADVVLPDGRGVELHGCSEEAHRLLQYEIEEMAGSLPIRLEPSMLLHLAVDRYQQ
jgi:hypothetical protein